MAGTWTSQNKVLPGAYINFKTNAPLSISLDDRGTVVLLQEITDVGSAGEMYTITADGNNYPDGMLASDKVLVNEILKNANKVILYNLGQATHVSGTVESALNALKTVQFDVLCYPYTAVDHYNDQGAIMTWVQAMNNDEGYSLQYVTTNFGGGVESAINVMSGVVLADGTTLTPSQVTAWVAGATAGASISQSNTGKKYVGAIDVVPRLTKMEMITAINDGKFIFSVDAAQNVTVVSDINSLVTITVDKNKLFKKNRVVRVINGIKNDINNIFESNYKGKLNNNADGRMILRSSLIDYFNELQRLGAIQNFTPEDVTVLPGVDSDSVVIDCFVQVVDAVEKMYITVNLS